MQYIIFYSAKEFTHDSRRTSTVSPLKLLLHTPSVFILYPSFAYSWESTYHEWLASANTLLPHCKLVTTICSYILKRTLQSCTMTDNVMLTWCWSRSRWLLNAASLLPAVARCSATDEEDESEEQDISSARCTSSGLQVIDLSSL